MVRKETLYFKGSVNATSFLLKTFILMSGLTPSSFPTYLFLGVHLPFDLIGHIRNTQRQSFCSAFALLVVRFPTIGSFHALSGTNLDVHWFETTLFTNRIKEISC